MLHSPKRHVVLKVFTENKLFLEKDIACKYLTQEVAKRRPVFREVLALERFELKISQI